MLAHTDPSLRNNTKGSGGRRESKNIRKRNYPKFYVDYFKLVSNQLWSAKL